MILRLKELRAPFDRRGIYGPTEDEMPKRARFLAPDTAAALAKLEGDYPAVFYWSDVFRSAEASLAARRLRRGAQRPGYSGHNYGFSVDLDVPRALKYLGPYPALLTILERYGLYCHRRDRARGFEEWHFNHLPDPGRAFERVSDRPTTWSRAVETRIVDSYGGAFIMTRMAAQTALAELRLYRGELDGIFGPLSTEALRMFQRSWGLTPDGVLDARAQRTLAYATADMELA